MVDRPPERPCPRKSKLTTPAIRLRRVEMLHTAGRCQDSVNPCAASTMARSLSCGRCTASIGTPSSVTRVFAVVTGLAIYPIVRSDETTAHPGSPSALGRRPARDGSAHRRPHGTQLRRRVRRLDGALVTTWARPADKGFHSPRDAEPSQHRPSAFRAVGAADTGRPMMGTWKTRASAVSVTKVRACSRW